MKSFTITQAQIEQVLGGLIADELSRRFNRHFDFLTIASWAGETELGADGLGLSDIERAACLERAGVFFGLEASFFERRVVADLRVIAEAIYEAIQGKLTEFSFKSAARDESNATCRHCADEIFQDAAAAANIMYGRRRLLSFVAPHSLLGFELTVLTPNLQSIESVDARGMTPDELSKTLAYGDVLVATPTLWRYMMREQLTSPDNTMAVSFGEAMTPELAAEMRKAGFGVMRELYGSTESGLMGWRDAPTEAYVLFDHWRYDGEALIRTAPDGGERRSEAMDYFEWMGERAFKLAGRRDGAVQVGAVNVQPNDVRDHLAQHAKINECRVKFDRNVDGGSRLVAQIVLKGVKAPDDATVKDIDNWCRNGLRQQERPRIFQFFDHLPKQNAAPE